MTAASSQHQQTQGELEMTLDEFYKEQQGLLLGFKMAWQKAHHSRPDMFPIEMESGEFDEAFYAFDGNEFDLTDID